MVVVIKPSFIKHADEKKRPLSILTAQVSPDGARLATGGMDQTVKIWSTAPILDEEQEKNPNAKKLLSTLSSHNGAAETLPAAASGGAPLKRGHLSIHQATSSA